MKMRYIAAGIIIAAIVIGSVYWYYTTTTAPKKVELTLHTKAGLWADFIRNKKIIESFKERMLKEKGVEAEVTLLTAPHKGYGEKLITAFAAEKAGDVNWMGPADVPGAVDAEYLLDLTPYVEKWPEWDQWIPASKRMVTYKGKVWAVPNDAATILIYYRKDLFERAGLPVPWQPESWDDVIEAGLKLKEKIPELEAVMKPYYELQLPMHSAGGDIYDPKDGKWIAKSDAILYMFKLYYDIFYTYELTPKELILENWDTRKLFADGKLAILIDGTWCYSEKFGPGMAYEIKDREKIVGYAYPPGSGKPGAPKYVSVLRDYTWVISSKTEHPDLAFELLKELVKPEIVSTWGWETAHLVVRKDAVIGKDKFLKWATTALDYAWSKPCDPGYSKYISVLKGVVRHDLIEEGKKPEECMNIFASQLIEKLGADKVKEL